MNFNAFQKEIEGVNYRVVDQWDIMLPFDTTRETIQKIIDKCREHLLLDWHIIYPEVKEKNPTPETNMYWERK